VCAVGTVARAGRDATELAFEMPVALPPAGTYEAAVGTPGGSVRHRLLALDSDGARLTPAVPALTGSRLRVELVKPAPAVTSAG
jgi:hypothetical protein